MSASRWSSFLPKFSIISLNRSSSPTDSPYNSMDATLFLTASEQSQISSVLVNMSSVAAENARFIFNAVEFIAASIFCPLTSSVYGCTGLSHSISSYLTMYGVPSTSSIWYVVISFLAALSLHEVHHVSLVGDNCSFNTGNV